MTTIKIASYNLWNGAAETYFRLIDFVKEQRFDVLCLQEINGWQDEDFARLRDFADRAGFTDYEYGNSNSQYKLATLTTLPVTARTTHVEGFWHCAVETHVKVGDLEVAIVNLHLDPWKEEPRLREIERLLKKLDLSKPTIVTGDFNSVSRQDKYPPEFLQQLQQHGIYKFGQNELDFGVTDRLAAAQLTDLAAQKDALDTTVPTPYNSDEEHGIPARLDYMFATADVLPLVRAVEVVKTPETDKISDHYPLVLTLGPEPIPEVAPTPPVAIAPPTPPVTPLPDPAPDNTSTEGEISIQH